MKSRLISFPLLLSTLILLPQKGEALASRAPAASSVGSSRVLRQLEDSGALRPGSLTAVGDPSLSTGPRFLSGHDLAGRELFDESEVLNFALQAARAWQSGPGLQLRPTLMLEDSTRVVHRFEVWRYGWPLLDQSLRVTLDLGGRVTDVAASLRQFSPPASLEPLLTRDEALSELELARGEGVVALYRAELGLVASSKGSRLVYRLYVSLTDGHAWRADVDASDGELVAFETDEIDIGGAEVVPAVDSFGDALEANAYKYLRGRFPMHNVLGTLDNTSGKTLVLSAYKGPHNLVDASREGSWIYLLDGASSTLAIVYNEAPQFNDAAYGPYVSAHVNFGLTLDYYAQTFGLQGFDGAGASVVAVVNIPDYVNAAWIGGGYYFVFGEADPDGDSWRSFGDGLDIVAHEFTHAFTAFSSSLDYSTESGAISETMSDVIGWGADRSVQYESSRDPAVYQDFGIGEKLFNDPEAVLRDLKNPQLYSNVDHVSYYLCSEEVHYNSGISSMAFVRMVQGSAGTGTSLSVTPLEADPVASANAAVKLFYDANLTRLSDGSTFADLRNALKASTPSDKPQYSDTIDQAFKSVGVCSDGSRACAAVEEDPHLTNRGTELYQYLGFYLSDAADFDGDGVQDILARRNNASDEDPTHRYSARLFFGLPGRGFELSSLEVAYLGDSALQGFALADVNGDGFSDAIIGQSDRDGVGSLLFAYGNRDRWVSLSDDVVQTGLTGDGFAYSLAAAGDVNADGFEDVILGAPYDQSQHGAAYMLLGGSSAAEYRLVPLALPEEGLNFGLRVAGVGDVDGDGRSETVVLGSSGDGTTPGTPARLVLGASPFTGLSSLPLESGVRALPLGDLNRDGLADFAVANTVAVVNGIPNAGQVAFYYGTSSLTQAPVATWRLSGSYEGSFYGRYVAAADLNGDGLKEVFVMHYEPGGLQAGVVDVYPGTPNGIPTTVTRQWVGDYAWSYFGLAMATRRDVGASRDSLVLAADGYLPYNYDAYCRIDWAGGLYQFDASDL